jgi:hypothetical protein
VATPAVFATKGWKMPVITISGSDKSLERMQLDLKNKPYLFMLEGMEYETSAGSGIYDAMDDLVKHRVVAFHSIESEEAFFLVLDSACDAYDLDYVIIG